MPRFDRQDTLQRRLFIVAQAEDSITAGKIEPERRIAGIGGDRLVQQLAGASNIAGVQLQHSCQVEDQRVAGIDRLRLG